MGRNDGDSGGEFGPVVPERLDVSRLTCPMTWVKTKIALERLPAGGSLDVACAPDSEALQNVPRSAREAGHAVEVDGAVVRIVKC